MDTNSVINALGNEGFCVDLSKLLYITQTSLRTSTKTPRFEMWTSGTSVYMRAAKGGRYRQKWKRHRRLGRDESKMWCVNRNCFFAKQARHMARPLPLVKSTRINAWLETTQFCECPPYKKMRQYTLYWIAWSTVTIDAWHVPIPHSQDCIRWSAIWVMIAVCKDMQYAHRKHFIAHYANRAENNNRSLKMYPSL